MSKEVYQQWRMRAAAADEEFVQGLQPRAVPLEVLQQVGSGLLEAVQQDVPGAADRVPEYVEVLIERGWRGDGDLAEALEVACGGSADSDLKPLPVDLDEFSGLLEGDPMNTGGYLDLQTGQTWPEFVLEVGEDNPDFEEDPDRWLHVHSEGSHDGYRDMVDFADQIEDDRLGRRLNRALSGRGAFRRFKDELFDEDPDLLARFHAYAEDCKIGRARRWLTMCGYRAQKLPPRQWSEFE